MPPLSLSTLQPCLPVLANIAPPFLQPWLEVGGSWWSQQPHTEPNDAAARGDLGQPHMQGVHLPRPKGCAKSGIKNTPKSHTKSRLSIAVPKATEAARAQVAAVLPSVGIYPFLLHKDKGYNVFSPTLVAPLGHRVNLKLLI